MAAQKVFVGNLPFTWKTADVRELFSAYGEVKACTLFADSGSRPAYGHVEMEAAAAAKAIAALSGSMQGGRPIQIHVQES